MTEKRIAAIIVAAGSGSRSGLDYPKQYVSLGGRAVVAYSHESFASHPEISTVIVAIGEGQEEMAREALAPVTDKPQLVTGGATRRDSVKAALDWLQQSGGADHVLIHDAARPFLPHDVIDTLIDALTLQQGAIPTLPVTDTLVRGEQDVMTDMVRRDGLFRVQTPQAFHFEVIFNAHAQVSADAIITDDASLLRALDIDVALVQGDSMLEKLTYPADFARAEAMLSESRIPRTGMGYDVHRLVADKPLWLCGVEIAHSQGLSGHSDADVAIHALVDALLGALAEGDIGTHFPPNDPQWKGAASSQFLEFAKDRVSARGGEIAHVDLTIICEAPKIGPHKEAMRVRLAELLEMHVDKISVKATTTERLGFTGRKEGIAAQAVATLLMPGL